MKTSPGVIQCYHGQALVDSKHQIIVPAEVFGNGQDNEHIEPMIEGAKENVKAIGLGEGYFDGTRGSVLEIDRKINSNGYTKENCVLSCYYCNNDKSYILDSEEYKKHFSENRKKYFEYLKNKK